MFTIHKILNRSSGEKQMNFQSLVSSQRSEEPQQQENSDFNVISY
jgi:hypothetical protein